MNYAYVLAIDPSGSYNEGKGTTGYCLMHCNTGVPCACGTIRAAAAPTKLGYWKAHIDLIDRYYKQSTPACALKIVLEDYLLYADKAVSQINSHMETSKLIGILQYHCELNKYPYAMQTASEVMMRWTDTILVYKNIIKQKNSRIYTDQNDKRLCVHERDAIRHAIHFSTFKNKEAQTHGGERT